MTISPLWRLAILGVAFGGLTGCEMNLRQQLGLVGQGPDEFRIVKNDRLQMPDDMQGHAEQLPEPRPGAASLVEPRPMEDARAALNMNAVASRNGSSASEAALIASADGDVSPEIRQQLREEAASGDDDDSRILQPLLNELFGKDAEDPDLLDPAAESRRLAQEAQRSKNPELVVPEEPKEE